MAYGVPNHFPMCPMIVHLVRDGCQQHACSKSWSHFGLYGDFRHDDIDEHTSRNKLVATYD